VTVEVSGRNTRRRHAKGPSPAPATSRGSPPSRRSPWLARHGGRRDGSVSATLELRSVMKAQPCRRRLVYPAGRANRVALPSLVEACRGPGV